MKRFIFILFLLFPIICFGKDNYKNIERLINNYDVLKYVKDIKDRDPSSFWFAASYGDVQYNKMKRALSKKSGSIFTAKNNIDEAMFSMLMMRSRLTHDSSLEGEFRNSIYEIMGVNKAFSNLSLNFIVNDEQNASASPDGYIMIYTGLLKLPNFDIYDLVGILAHEIAHYMFQHTLSIEWKAVKRHNKNVTIASILSGIEVGAAAYAAANGVNNQDTWNNIARNAALYNDYIYMDDHGNYRYRYTRELEMQADFVAYRFMEFIGIGGERYIQTLMKLDPENRDSITIDSDDHFSISDRINILLYLTAKSKLENIESPGQ
jgi:predicted Zn-dependent protease